MKNFLLDNEDLINDNNWRRLFLRCDTRYINELKEVLKNALPNDPIINQLSFTNSYKKVGTGSGSELSGQQINKLLDKNGFRWNFYYNNKLKTMRTLKYQIYGSNTADDVLLRIDFKYAVEFVCDILDKNNVKYKSVEASNSWTSHGPFRTLWIHI